MMLLEIQKIKKNFKILNIDHIAIATDTVNKLEFIFTDILGMDYNNKEYVKDENVNVLKIFGVNNETAIELIESDELDSSINRFIEKRGEGLHHIALNIDNLENAITYLKSKDISLVYDKPKIGSNNSIITFIHPKSTPGILIELCQKM